MSAVDILSLVHLMQFGDSMLPTGAFAFSGALEAAAQTGVVRDARTLQQYVVSALRQASTGDAVGLAFALRALCDDAASAGAPVSDAALARLGVIDLALYRRKLPEEFRDMMTKTGLKLAQLGAETTKSPLLSRWLSRITTGCTPGSYRRSLPPRPLPKPPCAARTARKRRPCWRKGSPFISTEWPWDC